MPSFFYFCQVDHYYFSHDKNHLLKDAQKSKKDVLIESWVIQSIEGYLTINNPMGLVDDFIKSITQVSSYNTKFLADTYDYLSAAYRLIYSSNQLEFLWDGGSHFIKYGNEWETQFNHWMHGLTKVDPINRSILKACVLKDDSSFGLLEKNFKRLVLSELKLKWDGRKKMLTQVA